MGRCLTTDQLYSLACDAVPEREAKPLLRHCEGCAVCRGLLDAWRDNQVYATDVRKAVRSGSSIGSSQAAIAGAFSTARLTVPLMSTDSIGGYQILGEVHRGGQGVVYRAIQNSTSREVAIKVAFEVTELAGKRPHRFDREVELASRLKHPSIIAIFDSGTTPDGRCYFVMDYVHGLPVDQYVRERELTLAQALELFVRICEAVNHAHQRGVIHRDLKPSNILVDGEGIPRVLDFGLAKALGNATGRFSSVVSAAGQLLGTVPYMAPEQLTGRPQAADIRTDVYALGVLLYELLAGCLPYDVGLAAPDMLRAITEGSLQPPSLRWSPVTGIDGQAPSRKRHGGSPVDDDLDTVTLRAMELNPERRYQNAADLARDVQHYLAGEPIEAKRDRGLYVLGKLLHRYRLPVSIAAGFVVLLAVGLAITTSLYFKVEEQRSVAQTERDRAVTARHEANDRAEQLRAAMYLGHISSARAATDAGDIQRVREELYVCPSDLRGFEWYWLASQFNHSSRIFREHDGAVGGVATAGAGWVISGGSDGTIRWWNPAQTASTRSISSVARWSGLAFAPDRDSYAVVDKQGNITVRAMSDDRSIRVQYRGVYRHMCFNPRSDLLAVGSGDGWIDLFEAATGKRIRRLGPHQACAYRLAFSPDGELLASCSWDETVRVWSVETGQQLFMFSDQHECLPALAWSVDGRKLFSGGCGGSLAIWDLTAGKLEQMLHPVTDHVTSLACSADGRLLAMADMSRNLCLIDANTGSVCGRLTLNDAWLTCLTFSDDGRWLYGGGDDGSVRAWELSRTPYTVELRAHEGGARAIAFGPDNRLASAGDDQTVKLWELPSGRLLHTFRGHEGKLRGLAFSPDGKWIASGSLDRTVRVWDTETGVERHLLTGHEDGVLAVAVSPDGRLIASGGSDVVSKGRDNSVRIWDSTTGAEVMCLRGHAAGVPAVTFTPDGTKVVSGGRDHKAIVWDLSTRKPVVTFTGHHATVRSVTCSADGNSVCSAGEDNIVYTWDPRTGAMLSAPLTHAKTLLAVALSPDGTRRATSGNWDYVNIWPRRDTNWNLLRLEAGSSRKPSIWSLGFSPDGSSLAASDERGDIRVWRTIRPDDLARSPQAATDIAAGAMQLWRLGQRNDAELLFMEALEMHRSIFGPEDPRTVELSRLFVRFQRDDLAEGPPVQNTPGSGTGRNPAASQPASPGAGPATRPA